MKSKAEIRAWEQRWAVPAALATLVAVGLFIAGTVVSSSVRGDHDAEVLRAVHDHGSSLIAGSLLQAAAYLLIAFPLVVLFRAAAARSERVRGQLIGLVAIAPLFLAVATGLNGFASSDAATTFVDGEAKSTLSRGEASGDCRQERRDDGAESFAEEYEAKGAAALTACEARKVEDDEASNALTETSLAGAATGFGIGGRLGFAVALLYTCLWAMRVGLLTRFWGSLGMALGVASLLGLMPFVMLWFIYLGVLLLGRVPGGRPPAWEAAEAIPWPTPGEQAAARLEADEGDGGEDRGPTGDPGGERRKRKRRD